MFINEKSYKLGSTPSIIRNTFEYGKKRASEIGADKVFDFSLGNPSVCPPSEINQTICDLLQNEDSVLIHGYTSGAGDMGVRKVIAEYINSNFNQTLSFKNIYMTCGAAASLSISLKAVMNEGDECIVFAPFFTEYRVFIENTGAKVVVSKPNLDNLQIDVEDFESKITNKTRAIIINSPNNPSGVVYPESLIKQVCQILEKKQKEYQSVIYLICDEPYRELVYGNVKVPYLMNYYDNTIVCYSYSKALSLPGERIGYIALSPKTIECDMVFNAICGAGRALGYVCAPSLFQQVIARNINSKVDVGIYKENRDILLNNLKEYGYQCVEPEGAFYLFMKALEPSAMNFCQKARDYELLLVPCDDFGVEGYVRISYCVDKQRIINSLPAFKKLAESYK